MERTRNNRAGARPAVPAVFYATEARGAVSAWLRREGEPVTTSLREILAADAPAPPTPPRPFAETPFTARALPAAAAAAAAAAEVSRLEARLYAEHLFYVTRFLVTLKNKKSHRGRPPAYYTSTEFTTRRRNKAARFLPERATLVLRRLACAVARLVRARAAGVVASSRADAVAAFSAGRPRP